MKKRLNFLTLLVLILALTAVAVSFALLFLPIGNLVTGSAENSNAVSASLALIIATIGFVIALYMQSAEYRRETEIVDGLQEARILLELMVSRASVAQTGGRKNLNLRFENEKQQLIETLKGPAGRFLNYIRITKDVAASEKKTPEIWRLLYVHTGNLLNAEHLNECASDLVGLLALLKSISGEDIHKHANKIISVDSIDALNAKEDIVIRAFRETIEENREKIRTQDADIAPEELARLIDELRTTMGKSEQGRKALEELEDSFANATKGDVKAAAYVVSIHKMIMKSD
ncbi:MAG: hypothetical protein GXP06_03705 [Alphaproteobacteria bacterium]|nr:hypothetical protein [Alphaproteobacteria bacterium]